MALMKILAFIALFGLAACSSVEKVPVVPTTTEVTEKAGKETSVMVMTEKVYNYAPNSSELQPHDKKDLLKIARLIVDNQNHYRRIEIVGHSDQTGSEDLNLDISKERAISILELLKEAGIERKKIRTSWVAGTEPLEEGTEESFINRRVEIRIFELKN